MTTRDAQSEADLAIIHRALTALREVLEGVQARPATYITIATVLVINYRRGRGCTTMAALRTLREAVDAHDVQEARDAAAAAAKRGAS